MFFLCSNFVSYVIKYLGFVLINYPFDLCYRHIKLFGKRFITTTVYKASFQYGSVTFRMYVFVNDLGYVRVGIFFHDFFLLGAL